MELFSHEALERCSNSIGIYGRCFCGAGNDGGAMKAGKKLIVDWPEFVSSQPKRIQKLLTFDPTSHLKLYAKEHFCVFSGFLRSGALGDGVAFETRIYGELFRVWVPVPAAFFADAFICRAHLDQNLPIRVMQSFEIYVSVLKLKIRKLERQVEKRGRI